MILHTLFDLLAVLASLSMTVFVYRWRLAHAVQRIETLGMAYALSLVVGAVTGGFGVGTLNLWISGDGGIGRSIVGALAGAIVGIEIFKARRGVKQSTGLVFVPAFAASVIVGRWGCFLSGMEDKTYGTPTTLLWGWDFGDGVLRHPVQLYESFAMALFLIFALAMLARRNAFFMQTGFYLLVLFYAAQRFLWEFLKPYGTVIGPLNFFHLVCLGLCCYALLMMEKSHERANP